MANCSTLRLCSSCPQGLGISPVGEPGVFPFSPLTVGLLGTANTLAECKERHSSYDREARYLTPWAASTLEDWAALSSSAEDSGDLGPRRAA